MAVLRTALVLLQLASLGRFATADDEFCMVQKNALLNQGDNLQPDMSLQPASFAVFEQLLEQVPVQTTLNLTAEDMVRIPNEFIEAFVSKAYIGTGYYGLQKATGALQNFSSSVLRQVQQLMEESRNATRSRAYFLLEHYTLQMDDAFAELVGSTSMIGYDMIKAAPQGAFRNSTAAMRAAGANMTKEKIADYIKSTLLRPKTKNVFDNRTVFCQRFMTEILAKSNRLDAALATIVPGIKPTADSLSGVRPLIHKIAHEAQPDIMRFLNTSLDGMYKSMTQVQLAFHLMTKARKEVAEQRLNCSRAAVANATAGVQAESAMPHTAHGGAPAARGGLAAVVALAASAWLVVA
mmetsp:Transcript_119910/g.373426  ORF Transcript_119910/g.373426 Transcript_119910/m.373426 type:complete len:351 (-) Transcript_119910:123-1175(-)